ncbi:hypothetical protein SEA_NUEVOMUNDO_48 [Mycobacterium phage NuevoMundo]|nr:hypothetical protein SEA_NUEVOMUNDO_48 [Mycobacterium phage NuevoMundo]
MSVSETPTHSLKELTMITLAAAPASINLADYNEVRLVGNVRTGDILSRDGHLLVVTKVVRTAKTIEIRAENANGEAGYGKRLWTSKHRSSTPVARALGDTTHIFRKAVWA